MPPPSAALGLPARLSRPGLALLSLLAAGCADAGEQGSVSQAAAEPWFAERTREWNVSFQNESGASGKLFMPEVMGAGVALFDADGDGDLDLFLASGHEALPQLHSAGAHLDRFYENRIAQGGGFVDATASSGLGDPDYGMGAAVGDIDNDGDLDLVVTEYEGLKLFRNDGQAHFEDVTAAFGLGASGWCTSAAFLDYDRDGLLDLYVARYVKFDAAMRCTSKAGKPDYCGPLASPPVSDLLLHNEGGARFRDVSAAAGIAAVRAAGLGVVCADFDGDGWVDVYVANDAYANQLWINRRDGTFQDAAFTQGVALNMSGHAEAGMGVVAADLDGEGNLDLFVTHLEDESNILFLSRGAGRGFRDATGRSGTGPSSVPYTGFGVVAFDIELDGDLDLVVANGRVNLGPVKPGVELPFPWNQLAEPKLVYLNQGDARFAAAPEVAGELGRRLEVSRGLAQGDLDGDGDIDLVVHNTASPSCLWMNQAPRAGHWLRVRALDPRYRRDALGARVRVRAGGRSFLRCVESSSSYLSSSDPRAHFGLGPAASVESVEITWPDGLSERFPAPGVDRDLVLQRGAGEALR